MVLTVHTISGNPRLRGARWRQSWPACSSHAFADISRFTISGSANGVHYPYSKFYVQGTELATDYGERRGLSESRRVRRRLKF